MLWHDLAWIAGFGSLLYFFVALLKPAWFFGDAPTDEEAEDASTAPINPT